MSCRSIAGHAARGLTVEAGGTRLWPHSDRGDRTVPAVTAAVALRNVLRDERDR
jgi:hypothetical protein